MRHIVHGQGPIVLAVGHALRKQTGSSTVPDAQTISDKENDAPGAGFAGSAIDIPFRFSPAIRRFSRHGILSGGKMRAAQQDGGGPDSGFFGHKPRLSAQNAFRGLAVNENSDVFLIHLSVEFYLEIKTGTGEKSRRINGVNGRGRIDTAGVCERQPQSGRRRQNRTFVHENTILVANYPLHPKNVRASETTGETSEKISVFLTLTAAFDRTESVLCQH